MSAARPLRLGFWAGGTLLLAALAVAGVSLGAVRVPAADVWRALAGVADPTTDAIVRTLRLPRVLLAALVGAGLGMSGAVGGWTRVGRVTVTATARKRPGSGLTDLPV